MENIVLKAFKFINDLLETVVRCKIGFLKFKASFRRLFRRDEPLVYCPLLIGMTILSDYWILHRHLGNGTYEL